MGSKRTAAHFILSFVHIAATHIKATETKRVSIAAMPVTSRRVIKRRKITMSKEQFEREKKYRTAITLAKRMLQSGIITANDFNIAEAHFRKKFQPVLAI